MSSSRMKRVIVVGDVHGCRTELERLLKEVAFRAADDRLVFTGDLVDRGPDPKAVLRLVRELGGETAKGNHEDKHERYRRHRLKAATNQKYKNPMRPFPEPRMSEHLSYDDQDWAQMEKMPLYIWLDKNWVVVHGGLIPGVKIEDQDPKKIIRTRYLDEKNDLMPLEDDFSAPTNGVYWTEKWDGGENVIYGHNVYSEESIRQEKGRFGNQLLGIDTGCCFGGRLTAVTLEPLGPDGILTWTGTTQVEAEKVYFQRHPGRHEFA